MSAPRHPSPSRATPNPAEPPQADAAPAAPVARRGAALPGAPRRRLDGPTGLALVALVVAAIALVLGAWSVLGPARASCQTAAWDAIPAATALPAGWTLGATDFYVQSQTTTLLGPADETTGSGAVVYSSVTCFGGDAGEVLRRSRSSAESAGATVEDVESVGDEGYSMSDSTTGSSAYHFRRGSLVAYMAVSGSVAPTELDQLAVAVDAAMAGSQGGSVPSTPARPTGTAGAETPGATVEPSPSPEESAEPEASPVAAALEARLPAEIDGVPLIKDSATADMVLGDDTSSRALEAALRSLNKTSSDLLLAQAYDEGGALAASILGFELPGVEGDTLRTIVLESWLMAGSTGVTTTEVTLSGRPVTKVVYGDGGADSYVAVSDDAVLVIDTTDAEQAERIIASLP